MTTPPAPVTEEIRAFQQGFGSPPALARALRQTRFLVAVDADGIAVSFRYPVGGEPGPRWVCAFTTPELAESFAERHGAGPGGSAGWRWLVRAGAELLDTLLPQFTERTGLFVDPGSEDAMSFPPTTEFVPHAEWAVDLDD
ncbi:hypothetical protein NCCP2495_33960 [Dietzia sp. NCCP-2495]|uniref:SseB family protein n=1 Tax=Dietzia sp. NCCP-2495 TaxID=2934675 RepID=UPI002231B46B|nr:SseB family protein [Dietzia sp. NCCP-2495]GLB65514.1 hypothetical protein NCCP2495_33960 [Dietzia sp. NCCP-2495]